MIEVSFSLKYFKKNFDYLLYVQKDLLYNNCNNSFIFLILLNLNSIFNLLFLTENHYKYRQYHHLDSGTDVSIENNRDLILKQELDFLKINYNIKEDFEIKQFQFEFNWLRNPESNINFFGYSWNLNENLLDYNKKKKIQLVDNSNTKFLKVYTPKIINQLKNEKIFLSTSDFLKYWSIKNKKLSLLNKHQNLQMRTALLQQHGLFNIKNEKSDNDNKVNTFDDVIDLSENKVTNGEDFLNVNKYLDIDYLKKIIFDNNESNNIIDYSKLLKKYKKKIKFIPYVIQNTSSFIDFSLLKNNMNDPYFLNEFGQRVTLVNEAKNHEDILNSKFNYTLLTEYESSENLSENEVNTNLIFNDEEKYILDNTQSKHILKSKLYLNIIFIKYIKYLTFLSTYFVYLFTNNLNIVSLPTKKKIFSILRSSVNYKKSQQKFKYIIKKKLIYFFFNIKELSFISFVWFFFNYIFLKFIKNNSNYIIFNKTDFNMDCIIFNKLPALINNFSYYKLQHIHNE